MQSQKNSLSTKKSQNKDRILLLRETLQNQQVLCLFFCNAPTFLAHQASLLKTLNTLNASSNHYFIYENHKKDIVPFKEDLLTKQHYKACLLEPKKTKSLPSFDSKYHLLLFSDCLDPNTLLFNTLNNKKALSIMLLKPLFPSASNKKQRLGNPKEHILLDIYSKQSQKKYKLIIKQLEAHQKTIALQCSLEVFKL